MKNSLRIFLLTRALDLGGAQRQLVLLARALRERGHMVEVGVFYSGGSLSADLQGCGVEIVQLGKKRRWDWLAFMGHVVFELRRRRPDVIYSFLGGANVVASAARPFIHKTRVVWSVRASNMDLANYGWASRWSYKLERALSHTADLIIANSSAGAAFAARNGFPHARLTVIPNGIDTDRFRFDTSLRTEQRRRFGLDDDAIAVGVLARLDRMKGHFVFLEAAAQIAPDSPKVRFFCIGEGPELPALKRMAQVLGIADRVFFPGPQDPVAALNALDVACSCSLWGEGFSNAIAEAMSCGLPCVVTDVGDSAAIVDGCGVVVQPASPGALANGLLRQIGSLSSHDRSTTRRRVVDNFSIDRMVDRTLSILAPASGRQ